MRELFNVSSFLSAQSLNKTSRMTQIENEYSKKKCLFNLCIGESSLQSIALCLSLHLFLSLSLSLYIYIYIYIA